MGDIAINQRNQRKTEAACEPGARVTRSLLGYGVLAGPFYVAVALVQAVLLRPGFDLARDDVSLLSNGALGWIQIANFLITGAMVVAAAIGMHRALPGGWAPRLLAIYGLGLMGAGVFVADPMNGFPAGAPADRPDSVSVHAMLHIVCAGIGFLAFVIACFVMARRFAREHKRGWTTFSIVAGVAFLVGFGAIASGTSSPAVVFGFWAALILAWVWLGSVSVHLYRQAQS